MRPINDAAADARRANNQAHPRLGRFLPVSREKLFAFFSDAHQLEAITPASLRLSVLTPRPREIRAGTRIDYRLRIHGLPIRWQSQITAWEPPSRFVDEQMRGPYRHWHHEHVFEIGDGGGTLCRDIVEYAVPGSWFIHSLIVRHNLLWIFEFRQQQLQEQFGGKALKP